MGHAARYLKIKNRFSIDEFGRHVVDTLPLKMREKNDFAFSCERPFFGTNASILGDQGFFLRGFYFLFAGFKFFSRVLFLGFM